MWSIEEMKKVGIAGKGDGDWEKTWIYRVLAQVVTTDHVDIPSGFSHFLA